MKRVFDPWPPLDSTDKGKNKFMVDACDALKPDQEIIPDWAQESPGYASAVSAPFGKTAFRFGMQQICGCTMLYVVSHKRVYLGECLQFLQGSFITSAPFQDTTGKMFHLEKKRSEVQVTI